MSEIDRRHGGPYDRGSADSYYRRGRVPHFYVGNTALSERVEEKDMTEAQKEEYYKGFDDNESDNNFKEWD